MPGSLPAGQWVLGGERRGLPIRGFELGNSPAEYTPDRVAGKTVVLTTTNGVRAMLYAREAENVLIAAFVNATAVVGQLLGQERVHVLCAGTDGEYSGDDILLAGMLVERLGRLGGRTYVLNAQAMAAREFWLHSFALPQALGAEPLPPRCWPSNWPRVPAAGTSSRWAWTTICSSRAAIDRFQGVPRLDRDGHIRPS